MDDDRQLAQSKAQVREEKPYLLTGSPPCDAFSLLNKGLNFPKMPKAQVEAILRRGEKHLMRAIDFYEEQLERGGHILHEHPWTATSWQHPRMKRLMEKWQLYLVKGPMCNWDMESEDENGMGLVKKETGWLTSSPELAMTLKGVCSNTDGSRPWHRHVPLIGGGRARKAAVYPPKMVAAVLRAIRRQMHCDGMICSMEAGGPSPHEALVMPQAKEIMEEVESYWDDVRGGWLEPATVRKARADEIAEVEKYGVIRIAPRSVMPEGATILDTTWSDTNKGTTENPEYRSRICAREIKRRQEKGLEEQAGTPADLFASMPPIEAVRFVWSLYASRTRSKGGKPLKVGLFDVRRAHFNATATRTIYIEVPIEMVPAGTDPKTLIGILEKSMYGTRDAGANWEKEVGDCCVTAGFRIGIACPNVFVHLEIDILVIIHGDDLHVLADDDGINYMKTTLEARYEIKVRAILGPEPKDDKQCTFLNRQVRITEENGVETEADPRHAQEIVRAMGVAGGKSVTTPIVKEPATTAEVELPALDRERCKVFRSTTMRACYLSFDRTDIQYAVKECAREMHNPTERGWARLKRLARYLLGQPRVIIQYQRQAMPTKLTIFTDSDHAGCKLTRKSTSGVVAMLGGHCIKTSSATQSTIGLSSPESEYYALVKGSSIGLGLQAVLADANTEVEVEVRCDASSGISLANRRGLGRARHVSTRYLWVQ